MSAQLPFSQPPAEPNLKDVLNQLKKDIFLTLNCHHIGTVQGFNSVNQTATATINYKKTYYKISPQTRLYAPVLENYPILVDCPVIFLGGGPTALTFPVATGDECLVLFNDRDLDNWFKGGSGVGVATTRLHSFADAIILVGLRSLGKMVEDFDTERAVLRYGETMVGVGEELIKISNDQYTLNELLQELNEDLQDLIVNIKALVTATAAITVTGVSTGIGVSGIPANAAAINAVTASLTTTANELTATADKIAGLLE